MTAIWMGILVLAAGAADAVPQTASEGSLHSLCIEYLFDCCFLGGKFPYGVNEIPEDVAQTISERLMPVKFNVPRDDLAE